MKFQKLVYIVCERYLRYPTPLVLRLRYVVGLKFWINIIYPMQASLLPTQYASWLSPSLRLATEHRA